MDTLEQKIAKIKKYLEEVSESGCWSDNDDFDVYDYSGDNFDDAFSGGITEGEVQQARFLLKVLSGEETL